MARPRRGRSSTASSSRPAEEQSLPCLTLSLVRTPPPTRVGGGVLLSCAGRDAHQRSTPPRNSRRLSASRGGSRTARSSGSKRRGRPHQGGSRTAPATCSARASGVRAGAALRICAVREAGGEAGARPRGARDDECAAEAGGALAHRAQPEVAGEVRRRRRSPTPSSRTSSVSSPSSLRRRSSIRRARGMLDDVVQRLLGDAVERLLRRPAARPARRPASPRPSRPCRARSAAACFSSAATSPSVLQRLGAQLEDQRAHLGQPRLGQLRARSPAARRLAGSRSSSVRAVRAPSAMP